MFNRRDVNVKKPSGGRPAPRRLFSIDSLKSTKSVSESDAGSSKDIDGHARNPSNASTTLLKILEKADLTDPFQDTGSSQWTDTEPVGSPEQELTNIPVLSTPKAHGSKPVPLNLDAEAGEDLDANGSSEAAPPPSPSKRRWDTIRTHVTRSSIASSLQRGGTPTISSSSSPPPSRPQTPVKQYRFAQKKIFRNVVDQAREVAVDESRRLEEEIRKACWMVRFGELQPRPKIEREVTQGTLSSSLHLPFMSSTTSLPLAASSSTSNVQAPTTRYGQLRRPPSMQSLGGSGYTHSPSHISREH